MRVLVIHNRYRSSQPSGENAVVEEESRLLAAAGLDVEVLEVESDEIATWPAAKRVMLPGRVVWSPSGARLVRRAIESTRPDVVHFHNTFPLLSPAALRAARAAGVGVVQTLHNFRPVCPAATLMRDGRPCESCLGRMPLPAVVHGCYRGSRLATLPIALKDAVHARAGTWTDAVDRYIVPSAFARGRFVAAGWPAELLTVSYNTAPDPGPIAPNPDGPVVCLSRLAPEKGVDILLEAWARAFPGGGPGLTVVGAGELERDLRARAAGLRGVELTGGVSGARALEILAGARALVVPSRWYEVFPRVVAEAYAHGVPVVAARLGSLAEIVVAGETGLHFDAGSETALATCLTQLEDPDLVTRLGRGARAMYERHLTPAAALGRLLAVYDDVTGGGAAQVAQPAAGGVA
jgi:glycosyltransferase involved in cell wall biosynthesis